MALYSRGDEDINPFNGCGGHCRLKKSDDKIVKMQLMLPTRTRNRSALADWDADAEVNDYNSASDNQTYPYAAGQTPERLARRISCADRKVRKATTKAVVQTATGVLPLQHWTASPSSAK